MANKSKKTMKRDWYSHQIKIMSAYCPPVNIVQQRNDIETLKFEYRIDNKIISTIGKEEAYRIAKEKLVVSIAEELMKRSDFEVSEDLMWLEEKTAFKANIKIVI